VSQLSLDPNTGFHVQGYSPDDDASEGTNNVFVGVTCPTCGLVHLVNLKTGKTPCESNE
jgi:hypothetical protein